jgi:hypothetical protein
MLAASNRARGLAARPIEGFVESIPGRFRGRRWTAFTSGKLLQFTLFADQKLLRL